MYYIWGKILFSNYEFNFFTLKTDCLTQASVLWGAAVFSGKALINSMQHLQNDEYNGVFCIHEGDNLVVETKTK